GGNQVQAVINRSCLDIQSGQNRLIAITGAENGSSSSRARKEGIKLPAKDIPGCPDEILGSQKPEHHEFETAKGIKQAIQVYPMYENAIRAARQESVPDHLKRVSELWARFNEVALQNPNAWIKDEFTAEEIRTPTDANRRISFPYTKMMNANMMVDMGAALILCSVGKARELGIPERKWIYPVAGVQGYDHFSASVRDNFYSSPGLGLVGKKVMELAKISPEEIDYVDLYSCFPSAVQIAARELGFSEERALTVTGGLTFGGGPLNNYVMHAVARTAELLRETPEATAFVSANGGNLYKHVHCVYSSQAPEEPFHYENIQQDIDALPSRVCLPEYNGKVDVESYSVMYTEDKPAVAHCAGITNEGARVWSNCYDEDVLHDMTLMEFCGRTAVIRRDGTIGNFS
ncbi:MAG: acetyl-CoA acetyltransferase, partial [Gammaproteobacteria bacterium]|nr:acetyl-CoA acetyltransferase [Gammaproteobacteria bacterium]